MLLIICFQSQANDQLQRFSGEWVYNTTDDEPSAVSSASFELILIGNLVCGVWYEHGNSMVTRTDGYVVGNLTPNGDLKINLCDRTGREGVHYPQCPTMDKENPLFLRVKGNRLTQYSFQKNGKLKIDLVFKKQRESGFDFEKSDRLEVDRICH
jgi:hypothetical protein